MPDTYNSNNVGHSVPGGGAVVFKKADGTDGGTFVVEALSFERDGNAIARSNHEGGYGGFAIPATPKQVTGNITIQIDSDANARPEAGWYTDGTYRNAIEERLVLTKVSDPFNAGQSWTVTADFMVDHFAP